ncbi:MAG TPA: PaaI family thioesterase [Candidatus Polarisedimenticolia bacterium]|nr:PaaI family thioesterase [Candidatus Polarisedimenticolia bacterium]
MLSAKQRDALIARARAVPIVSTLKMDVRDLAEGYCETFVERDRIFDGIMETLHGGLLMTIADTTACWAILTHWGPRAKLATTDMSIRFLAPCNTGVIAKARVIKAGRTLCPTAVDMYDGAGRLVAVAQVTYIRLGDVPDEGSTPAASRTTLPDHTRQTTARRAPPRRRRPAAR